LPVSLAFWLAEVKTKQAAGLVSVQVPLQGLERRLLIDLLQGLEQAPLQRWTWIRSSYIVQS